MERFLPLLLDVLAVLLVVLCVRQGVKKGFVRAIIQLAGFLISLFAANALSAPAARFLFDQYIRKGLVEKIGQELSTIASADQLLQSLESALESIPEYLTNALAFAGLPVDFILPDLSADLSAFAGQLVDQTIAPTCIALLTTVCFLIFFSVLSFLTKLVAKSFTGLRHIPLVGPVNSFLGGCMGAIEGILSVYLAVTVASLVLALAGDAIPFLSRQTLESTFLVRLFLDQNALGKLPAPDLSAYVEAWYSLFQGIAAG